VPPMFDDPVRRRQPRPVPFPFGLVVKNGSKSRAMVALSMPQPVSVGRAARTSRGDGRDHRIHVVEFDVLVSIVSCRPGHGVAGIEARFVTICSICPDRP